MNQPKDTRPFNLEHAKAGAPFSGEHGQPIQILAWDRKHPTHPIVGMEADGEQELVAFRVDGTADHGVGFITSRLVMLPLCYLYNRPVFVGDELETDGPSGWSRYVVNPSNRDFTNDRWPAPARVYPETRMSDKELREAYGYSEHERPLRATANAALRHAIDAGQVKELPFPGVMVAYDLSPTEQEGAIRTKMQELGWSTPEQTKQMEAINESHRKDLCAAVDTLQGAGWTYKASKEGGGGTWTPPARVRGSHFYGRAGGFYVEGTKASIDKVQELAERGLARDMAVAEAVRDACYVAAMNCEAGHEGTVIRQVPLGTLIGMVKP